MLKAMKALGFTAAGWVDPQSLRFLPQVRGMCADNLCHSYGKSWCCPPACGELTEITAQAQTFSQGVVVATRCALKTPGDLDEMKHIELEHQKRFHKAMAYTRARYERIFPMGAGVCSLCETCSYPQEPCRHPEWLTPSMEACGLMILHVCEAAGLPYAYGEKDHVTFVSLILLDKERPTPLPEAPAPTEYHFKPWVL
ncbi:MAG: DUF2284 domain-containing protein [Clostridia bacterium]|nr:DUF2284 domain-containing protein [Clostridia bacterium]